jgi:hypothetical protein
VSPTARTLALLRHVLGGANEQAAERLEVGAGRQLGHAEIANLGLAVAAEQDVGRFEVAVDDVVLMGIVDRTGQGFEPCGRLPRRRRPVGQPGRQAAALDELQREVGTG